MESEGDDTGQGVGWWWGSIHINSNKDTENPNYN